MSLYRPNHTWSQPAALVSSRESLLHGYSEATPPMRKLHCCFIRVGGTAAAGQGLGGMLAFLFQIGDERS